MRTHDEIKKGLECCKVDYCSECPYVNHPDCIEQMCDDGLAYIHQLKAERDAAVADLKEMCAECSDDTLCCNYCKYQEDGLQCHHDCKMYTKEWDWQWRGVCDENITPCTSEKKSQEGK